MTRLLCLIGLLCSATCLAGERKAVFILLDGIPADVIERVETPAIDQISSVGRYTRAYVGGEVGTESESPTISAVAYQSLITGTWANKHNVYDNDVDDPDYNYWDIFRIVKYADPTRKTAIFSTWEDNRTKLLGDGLAEAGGNKLDYVVDGFEHDEEQFPHDLETRYIQAIDTRVATDAAGLIREVGPDLSWVYLQYTDNVGHAYGDGDVMDKSVAYADDLVAQIWHSVVMRMQEHGEDWLVVVTTDHGRDADSGRSHGDQSVRERTIWIATNQKNLNANFNAATAIVDVLPSIVTFLGLTIPESVAEQLDGKSFIDE